MNRPKFCLEDVRIFSERETLLLLGLGGLMLRKCKAY